ncbi:KTSC domain-containing protein [Clostridium beijerinckii]|nr:KTSC domain-containing protein [Clostridium beijerinckii]
MDSIHPSSISTIVYDIRMSLLFILFSTGQIYEFTGVPYNVYRNLISAQSKYKYYDDYINGKYSSKLISQ